MSACDWHRRNNAVVHRSVAAAAWPPEKVDKRAANAANIGPEAGLCLCQGEAENGRSSHR
jgi:hypothetical protein